MEFVRLAIFAGFFILAAAQNSKKWTPSITATKDHALSLAIKNSLRMCTGAFPTVAKNSGNRTVFKDDTVTFHSNVWPDLKVSSESALQPWVNSSREDAFIMEELLPLRPLERRPRQADNSSKLTGVTLPEPEGNRSNTAGRMKDSTASSTASVPREVEVMEGSGAEEFVTDTTTSATSAFAIPILLETETGTVLNIRNDGTFEINPSPNTGVSTAPTSEADDSNRWTASSTANVQLQHNTDAEFSDTTTGTTASGGTVLSLVITTDAGNVPENAPILALYDHIHALVAVDSERPSEASAAPDEHLGLNTVTAATASTVISVTTAHPSLEAENRSTVVVPNSSYSAIAAVVRDDITRSPDITSAATSSQSMATPSASRPAVSSTTAISATAPSQQLALRAAKAFAVAKVPEASGSSTQQQQTTVSSLVKAPADIELVPSLRSQPHHTGNAGHFGNSKNNDPATIRKDWMGLDEILPSLESATCSEFIGLPTNKGHQSSPKKSPHHEPAKTSMILVCGNPHTVPAFGFSAYEIECNSGDAYYRAHANGEAVGKIGPQIIRVETTHQVNLIKTFTVEDKTFIVAIAKGRSGYLYELVNGEAPDDPPKIVLLQDIPYKHLTDVAIVFLPDGQVLLAFSVYNPNQKEKTKVHQSVSPVYWFGDSRLRLCGYAVVTRAVAVRGWVDNGVPTFAFASYAEKYRENSLISFFIVERDEEQDYSVVPRGEQPVIKTVDGATLCGIASLESFYHNRRVHLAVAVSPVRPDRDCNLGSLTESFILRPDPKKKVFMTKDPIYFPSPMPFTAFRMIDSGCDHMLLACGYGSKTMFFKKISSSRSEGGRLSLGTVPYMETPANLIDSTVGTCDNRPMLSFSRPDSKDITVAGIKCHECLAEESPDRCVESLGTIIDCETDSRPKAPKNVVACYMMISLKDSGTAGDTWRGCGHVAITNMMAEQARPDQNLYCNTTEGGLIFAKTNYCGCRTDLCNTYKSTETLAVARGGSDPHATVATAISSTKGLGGSRTPTENSFKVKDATTATTNGTSPAPPKEKLGISTGVLIGIVGGSLAILLGGATGVYLMKNSRKKKEELSTDSEEEDEDIDSLDGDDEFVSE